MFEFAVQEIRRNITMCVHTFMLYFLSVRMKKRQIVIMLVYSDKLYIYVVSYDYNTSHENKIPSHCFVPQLHTHIRVYPSISLRGNFEDLMTRNGVPLECVMVYEALRLKSFFGVDIAVSRIQLAKAGFYATGDGDETRCFCCGVRYRNWQHGDKPASVPHKHYCRHNHDLHRGNVSFTENPLSSSIDCALTQLWYPTSDFDVHDPSPEIQRLSITHPNRRPRSAISPQPTAGTNHQAPGYSSETNRLASFRGWPSERFLRELSAAGFYYTGNSDNVQCFRCGLVLRAWDEEDDPWRVHARLRPDCPFLAARCPPDTTPQVAELRSHEMQPQKIDPKHKEETKDLTESNLLKATKENTEQLRDASACKICLENPANIIFLPCGHLVACGVCSPALERCPVCRKHIRGTVRVHLAHIASREATTQNTSHNVVTSSQTAEGANMGYNNHQSEQISGNISPKQSTLSDSERGNNAINNSNAAVNASLGLPVTSKSRKAERTQKHDKTKDQLNATEEETEQLRETSECTICLENPANIVFLPCGHLVACGVCSPALERCPVCRTRIRGIIPVP
ncbi:baculoviral IAP repeat-containing protein 7-B-like [Haliotis cracherodii]|uniref:baculoviral IAP repeat-containing protein 7-B-like n=1 Tax=Haliotis cracherodii TaxID=6455 RepID=UPI0039EB2BB3